MMPIISDGTRALFFSMIIFASFGVFFNRGFTLIDFLKLGKAENRLSNLGERLSALAVQVGGHKRMFRISYSGLLHFFIFYAFVILGSVVVSTFGEGYFGPSFEMFPAIEALLMKVPVLNLTPIPALVGFLDYPVTFSQDIIIVLGLVGLGMAFYQRLFNHPDRFKGSDEEDAYIILGMITGVILTTLLTLSTRQALGFSHYPAWAAPVRTAMGALIHGLAGDSLTAKLFEFGWWGHGLVVFSFLPYLLYSKHMHVIVGIPNILVRDTGVKGRLEPLDLEDEEAEIFGVGEVDGFGWKHMLDFYSCTECGRCQDVCPAHIAGKPLSPKLLIMDLRDHLNDVGPNLLSMAQNGGSFVGEKQMVGDVIQDDTLWACTTCRACMEECPLFIEHVDDIVDMRRYLALTEGRMPEGLAFTIDQVTKSGNPWGYPASDRLKWAEGLDVPIMADKKEVEVLYWVGCAGSYDPNGQKTSQSVVKILREAGIDFAVLGQEERCNCEWARRGGDEYTFQEATKGNIDVFSQYKFKIVLTHCPHCFNTLANEYGDFGGHYEVMHHSTYISQLIADGRIKPKNSRNETITYHDACYLGRYNDIYDDPRNALAAIPGVKMVEMEKSRDKGMCCGGGGANVWYEVHGEREVNEIRLEQAMEAGDSGTPPQTIGAACPYCKLMLDSAIQSKGVSATIQIKDIAEIVAESIA